MTAYCAGVAGVYDVETHYQYEYGRGVAELSTMKRAMGGRHKFPTQSPALILNSACGGKAQIKLPGIAESPVGSRYGLCRYPFCSWHVTVPRPIAVNLGLFLAYLSPKAHCSQLGINSHMGLAQTSLLSWTSVQQLYDLRDAAASCFGQKLPSNRCSWVENYDSVSDM